MSYNRDFLIRDFELLIQNAPKTKVKEYERYIRRLMRGSESEIRERNLISQKSSLNHNYGDSWYLSKVRKYNRYLCAIKYAKEGSNKRVGRKHYGDIRKSFLSWLKSEYKTFPKWVEECAEC